MKPGDMLGPYKIIALIGEGGMGQVYKAHDPNLDRFVAIKVSKTPFDERFQREAKSLAAVCHPNVCTLYEAGPNYLVMEFIEGIPPKGPLPLPKALEYAGQILDGLGDPHRKGLTHRDLKPSNIMVTRHGIKLLDFGLAKRTAPIEEEGETQTAITANEEIIGTLQYMAPELLQHKPPSARSDIYAFGCVLYEMIAGRRAFDGDVRANVIAAILEHDPTPLDVPAPLWRIIAKCLAKNPDERFQNAQDLKYHLGLTMEQQPVAVAKSARWHWALAAGLLLGALGGWALLRQQTPVESQAVRLHLDPPEGGQFDATSLAISPDGRTLAFAAVTSGKKALWVRPLDGTAARLLPGTENPNLPFWSPDGRSIAYFTTTKLWRVDVAGGAPVDLCNVNNARGGVWDDDGTIVFAPFPGGLLRISASGGSPVPLTTLDVARGEFTHSWPQRLPGGRLMYWVRGRPEDEGIYAISLANPKDRVRLNASRSNALFASGHLLWLRGSTLMAQRFDPGSSQLSGEPQPLADPVAFNGLLGQMNVTASTGGVMVYSELGSLSRLTWFDRSGKALGTLGDPGDYTTPRMSPDGRQLAVGRTSGSDVELWKVEIDRNAWSRFTFAGAEGVTNYPVWSPDGSVIAFRSGPQSNLFRKDSGGAGTEQPITESRTFQVATDWSRDGRLLLYFEIAPETQRDLWVLPVEPDGKPAAGTKPVPYLRTRFNELSGRFSPEPSPRWVAYQSDETGRNEIYVQAFPEPRRKWQISTGGGAYPEWGPGGKEMFYLSPDNKLMAVSLKVGADSVEPSAPRELFALRILQSSVFNLPPYTSTSDGQRFLVRTIPESNPQPLQVILNWPALLRKGAAAAQP